MVTGEGGGGGAIGGGGPPGGGGAASVGRRAPPAAETPGWLGIGAGIGAPWGAAAISDATMVPCASQSDQSVAAHDVVPAGNHRQPRGSG